MVNLLRSLLFGSSTAGPVGDLGLFVLRLFTGLALALAHGLGKFPPAPGFVKRIETFGFPQPEAFGWLSGFAEFGGGLLLAVGLFTRPAAALIATNMTIAVVYGHAGDPFLRRELALLFGAVAIAFLFVGAGRYGLDALARPSGGGGGRAKRR